MEDCIFCKIARDEIPSPRLYQDDKCFVIRDINPVAPSHLLVIPYLHIADLARAAWVSEPLLGHLFAVAAQSAWREGIADSGYRLVVNQGPDSGRAVTHLHVHVLGGRRLLDQLG
ncbi:MAG: histidine triad nucleotide-binding protein [Chloroflexi bacterium]|nr:histidine triad nucleotide-binding protein [Chloroflexota bacterium]